MRPWLTRALVLAVLHAAADTTIAYFRLGEPTRLTVPRGIALGLLVGAAVLWGALDRMHGKPDRAITWVKASVAAGLLAAVLGLIAKGVLLSQTSGDDVWPAITGGAAFTALLILVPAAVGLAVGGALRVARKPVDEEDEDEEESSPRPRRRRAESEKRPSPRPRHRRTTSGSADSDDSDDSAAEPDEAPSPRPRKRPADA